MAKEKKIVIVDCGECPYQRRGMLCSEMNDMYIDKGLFHEDGENFIPDWCPLEDN
jgi:hypothetical protein